MLQLRARIARHSSPFFVASALALAALAGGCERNDADLKAVQAAERRVAALTGEGAQLTLDTGSRRAELKKIYDAMKGIPGESPVATAGLDIAAKARAALANMDARTAVEATAGINTRLNTLRTELGIWVSNSSTAVTAKKFDPTAESASYRASLDRVKASRAEAQSAADRLSSEITSTESMISSKQSEARTKRELAASLKAQVEGGSASAGLALMEQSAAARLEADRLDTEATELGSQLAVAKRSLAVMSGQVAAQDAEIKRLESDIAEVAAKGQHNIVLASNVQTKANEAAKNIKAQYDALQTYRSTNYDAPINSAISGVQEALELTRKSASGAPAATVKSAKLAEAFAMQSQADLWATRARTEQSFSQIMSLLASADPALPDAKVYRTAADSSRSQFDELMGKAREAYKSVAEKLGGISDANLKAKLDGTKAMLEELSSKQGVKVDEAAAAPSKPTPAPTESADAAVLAGVKKAIDGYYDALRSNDAEFGASHFEFRSEGDKDTYLTMMKMTQTMEKLDAACKEKLGTGFAEAAGLPDQAKGMLGGDTEQMTKIKNRTSADFTIKPNKDGSKASIAAKEAIAGEFEFGAVSKGGTWKLVPPPELSGMQPVMMMIKPMMSTFEQLTEDIKSGKISSPEQLKATLKTKMPMMGGGIGGMGGMGGGGGMPDGDK